MSQLLHDRRMLTHLRTEATDAGSPSTHRLLIHVAPGAEPWAPQADEVVKLELLLSRDSEIFYWPRFRVHEIYRATHSGQDLPEGRTYLLRAWAKDGRTHIFVDQTETRESTLWLTLHELTHLELPSSPYIARAFRGEPKAPNYYTNDAVHEARPEEQLANHVADRLALDFGIPGGLNRLWWRARVRAINAR